MTTVVIWVSDLTKSAEFYKDLFQANDYYSADGFASVAGSGNEVLLHLLPEEYRAEPSIGEENPIKPVFGVSSIQFAKDIANAHGLRVRDNLQEHNGQFYLDAYDPDGHVIQFSANQK